MQCLVQRALLVLFSVFLLALADLPARASGAEGVAAMDRTAVAVRYASFDIGPAPSALPIRNMQIVLRMSAGQRQALEAFIADRENPQSSAYHQWLTPEQFGARFGASEATVAKVTAWLRASGMTGVRVSRGRLFVLFSGTAETVERALGCRVHLFDVNGKRHFANRSVPRIPSALGDAVAQVVGLDDFTARPQWVRAAQSQAVPASGASALGPEDLAAIYNTAALYSRGIDGSGITVAVLGQTPVGLSDYRAYRQMFGLAANDFQSEEFPGSGTGTGDPDDLMEATLDLETIGAVARAAKILYVWGSTVEVAAVDAIDNRLAQVMSQSYAACETGSDGFYQMLALEAGAEGITWLSAAGDSGAAGCDATGSPAARLGLNVMVPASAPNITAVGGTAFASGGFGQYGSGDHDGSAPGYVSETGWSSSTEVQGGGGGLSALFDKPGFQSDVGPATTSGRMVPDVALAAAPAPVPYAIVFDGAPTLVGGTSAATPVFAGIAALVNEYLVAQGSTQSPGLGNMNPALYLLAEQAPWVFHDVTAGSNEVPCMIDTPDCAAGIMLGYAAGPGYDEATGLGSVDAYALASNWTSAVLEPSATSLSAAANTAEAEQPIGLTAAVTAGGAPLAGSPVEFYYSNPQYQACSTILGAAVTDATGKATLATSLLPRGENTVVAAATGTTRVAPSPDSQAVTVAVTGFPATVEVVAAAGPYQIGQTAALHVSVTGLAGATLAGTSNGSTFFTAGTVSLYNAAGSMEATAALSSSGTADLTTAALTAGNNSFYVSYSGSAYAAPAQSADIVLDVAAQPAADFTLSGASAVWLTAGSSASAPLTITPLNGFNRTIYLSCTGLPADATCALPATVTPAGATPVTVTFASSSTTLAAAVPMALLLVMLVGAGRRRKRFAALIGVTFAAASMVGCAAGLRNSGISAQSSKGYLATVTATSGSIRHHLTIEVTFTE